MIQFVASMNKIKKKSQFKQTINFTCTNYCAKLSHTSKGGTIIALLKTLALISVKYLWGTNCRYLRVPYIT